MPVGAPALLVPLGAAIGRRCPEFPQFDPWDVHVELALDGLDVGEVLAGDEGVGLAGAFGATGAADAVGVGVRGVGDIEVDDVADLGDVDASGRDIRLEVDGGIKTDNIKRVADAGADTFVAGSAIFGQPDYAKVIADMRAELA